jgi:histidine triad (HIT) family protein
MAKDCIFCKIIGGEIKSDFLYQDNEVVAFRDINPKALTHILVIPRDHIPSLNETTPEHKRLLGHMVNVASALARSEKVDKKGFRLIMNAGPDSGQEVPHLHLHLLGGQKLAPLG